MVSAYRGYQYPPGQSPSLRQATKLDRVARSPEDETLRKDLLASTLVFSKFIPGALFVVTMDRQVNNQSMDDMYRFRG